MKWIDAKDISILAGRLIKNLDFAHIKKGQIVYFRSFGSKSRARARIWSMPRIWQQALSIKPHYIIEVISERFDHLPHEEKQKTIIHELLHIPRNFSGSLLPHRTKSGHINTKVRSLFNILNKK